MRFRFNVIWVCFKKVVLQICSTVSYRNINFLLNEVLMLNLSFTCWSKIHNCCGNWLFLLLLLNEVLYKFLWDVAFHHLSRIGACLTFCYIISLWWFNYTRTCVLNSSWTKVILGVKENSFIYSECSFINSEFLLLFLFKVIQIFHRLENLLWS